MDFNFSAEQEELRKLAQKAFAGRDVLVEAQRAGLITGDLGFVDLCIVLEQLGRASRPRALDAALLGALAVAHFGTPELQRRTGDSLLVLATDQLLQAERVGTGFLLSGVLQAVPLVEQSTRLVVVGELAHRRALFLLDPRATARLRQLPTDESELEQLTLDRAHVDEADLLLPQAEEAMEWLAQRRAVALCAVELGLAQTQLQMTSEHVMRRQQFGKPIGLFQAVAQRVADMWVDVESLRLVTWHAAWLLSENRSAAREVHAAAFFAAEAGQRVANAAQHIHAGIGFDRAYPLYRYFLAAKQLELSLGGAAQRLAEIGKLMAEVQS